MTTAGFWRSALERAVKTFAQTLAATLAVVTGLADVDWRVSLSVSGLAAALSLLTSIGSAPFGPEGSPSLAVDTAASGFGVHPSPVRLPLRDEDPGR